MQQQKNYNIALYSTNVCCRIYGAMEKLSGVGSDDFFCKGMLDKSKNNVQRIQLLKNKLPLI